LGSTKVDSGSDADVHEWQTKAPNAKPDSVNAAGFNFLSSMGIGR